MCNVRIEYVKDANTAAKIKFRENSILDKYALNSHQIAYFLVLPKTIVSQLSFHCILVPLTKFRGSDQVF